ncbi:MAG: TatD family deoxyribonuclease [Gammaproteobacteria bacterium]|nr:MAG: TatD family deoxyribonuclease [Gammaproteobacteria bacterium]
MQLADSHCHLNLLDFKALGPLDAIMARARERGVSHVLCVSIDMERFPKVLDIARTYEGVRCSVGVHPNAKGREPEARELVEEAQRPEVVAIGETGLDYYRGGGASQKERFRKHIAAAREVGKPLIVHTRQAKEDTLQILKEERAFEVGGVMHCFTEDWAMAEAAMDMGFYISFSGIVTFQNAQALKEVARKMPLERMLVETDAPYLTPVPLRGKPNEPANVFYVAEHIASLKEMPLEEVADQTTGNYLTLFKAG